MATTGNEFPSLTGRLWPDYWHSRSDSLWRSSGWLMLRLVVAHSTSHVGTKCCETVGIAAVRSCRCRRCFHYCRHCRRLSVPAANSAAAAGDVVAGIAGVTATSIAVWCSDASRCSSTDGYAAGCDTSTTTIDTRRADTDGSVPSWFCRRFDADGGRIPCRCPTVRRPHGRDRNRMIGHVCRSRNALHSFGMRRFGCDVFMGHSFELAAVRGAFN